MVLNVFTLPLFMLFSDIQFTFVYAFSDVQFYSRLLRQILSLVPVGD